MDPENTPPPDDDTPPDAAPAAAPPPELVTVAHLDSSPPLPAEGQVDYLRAVEARARDLAKTVRVGPQPITSIRLARRG